MLHVLVGQTSDVVIVIIFVVLLLCLHCCNGQTADRVLQHGPESTEGRAVSKILCKRGSTELLPCL